MGYSVKDSTRGWSLLYLPDMNIQSIIEEANKHLKEINTIALQMPNNRKEEFVEQIINLFAKARFLSSLELTIIILEQNMRANVENIVRIKENRINAGKLRIYYTLDNTNKFYYSASGNSKINNAITAKQKKLILCNEDLNIKHVSHRCNKNF